MVTLSGIADKKELKILEPACGHAPFLRHIKEHFPNSGHSYLGIEIDKNQDEKALLLQREFEIIDKDFLLWETNEKFDFIIGNPPYGIIGDSSHYPIHVLKEFKELYKKKILTWKGKFNIYGAFLEKAVNLLKPRGKLIFIIPSTWLILDDYEKLRKFLAENGKTSVFYLGNAFPKRQVTVGIVLFEKGLKGLELWADDVLIRRDDGYKGGMIRFEDESTITFERDKTKLGELFDCYFAARSPEFRAHPQIETTYRLGLVPALTGRNLKAGKIDYSTCFSGFWLSKDLAKEIRWFYGFPHIVVGATKGGKVVSALDDKCYPWREEIHLVQKSHGLIDEAELVNYLNSDELNEYFSKLYRDLSPHVSITQLGMLPIPKEFIAADKKELSLFTE